MESHADRTLPLKDLGPQVAPCVHPEGSGAYIGYVLFRFLWFCGSIIYQLHLRSKRMAAVRGCSEAFFGAGRPKAGQRDDDQIFEGYLPFPFLAQKTPIFPETSPQPRQSRIRFLNRRIEQNGESTPGTLVGFVDWPSPWRLGAETKKKKQTTPRPRARKKKSTRTDPDSRGSGLLEPSHPEMHLALCG